MLERIQKLNPEYKIESVYDSSFKTYGKVVKDDVQDIITILSAKVQPPKNGNNYIKSDEILEQHPTIKELSLKVYGHMDAMAGIVSGHNQVLNGIEYHQGSETIIAVTDFVLVVGHVWDMHHNQYDSSLCKCFYVPQGTVVECYSTTLHYTPICVSDKGFITVCMLLRGTGDAIEKRNGILKKKNKWFIAHTENLEKIQEGDLPGLKGNMIKIEYK